MRETITALDVKEINDIPHIQDYYDLAFTLMWYSKEDDVQYYVTQISENVYIEVYIISKEGVFCSGDSLHDLANQPNIVYFEFAIGLPNDTPFEMYYYRPLICDRYKRFK